MQLQCKPSMGTGRHRAVSATTSYQPGLLPGQLTSDSLVHGEFNTRFLERALQRDVELLALLFA